MTIGPDIARVAGQNVGWGAGQTTERSVGQTAERDAGQTAGQSIARVAGQGGTRTAGQGTAQNAARETHKNIPIFIPHVGCPHRCTFCDQRQISGHGTFDFSRVRDEIESAVATLPTGCRAEIAYFGGSFTAIARERMVELLELAQHFVDAGAVSGIRFSTRPDALSEDVLDILTRYTVSAVEIGLQSMDDRVLSLTARGHTAAVAEDACRRVVGRGFPLVGQMMLGLPGSDRSREMETARKICALGASAARVYPTVVFDATPLADAWRRGEYRALTVDEAAQRCADVMEIFEENGVRLLRVGLCATEMPPEGGARMLAGAFHPALGEMARGVMYLRRMREGIAALTPRAGDRAIVLVARGKRSQAIGQHRGNITALCREFSLCDVNVCEDDTLCGMQVRVLKT